MFKVADCIAEQHELWLVALAAFLCWFAVFTAVLLWRRAVDPIGTHKNKWLAGSALAMGSGVWVTHFVSMLAYRFPWPVSYDPVLTCVSALAALSFIWLALWLARTGLRAVGGALMGVAICVTHFTGMAALEGPFRIQWDPAYLAAALGIGIAVPALTYQFAPILKPVANGMLVVLLHVLAVCGLHFTAMAAARFYYDPTVLQSSAFGLDLHSLAIFVAVAALLLYSLGLVGAVMDHQLAQRAEREAERLRRHVMELETTQSELRKATRSLSEALDAAAASSQAKSQFLAAMSHELRTPLNAILGFSKLIMSEMNGAAGNPKHIQYASDIYESGNHLLGLINDLLDFSKIEAGRFKLVDELVDMADLLSECMRFIHPQADEEAIVLEEDFHRGKVLLRADRRRVRQIVLNLLSNAVKFTPQGGHVQVCLSVEEDGVHLIVKDTGVGMTPEQIPIALELFGQVDNGWNRKFDGTGLGLPLSRRLAEMHGGTLRIDSKAGLGTAVTVLFPRERLVNGDGRRAQSGTPAHTDHRDAAGIAS